MFRSVIAPRFAGALVIGALLLTLLAACGSGASGGEGTAPGRSGPDDAPTIVVTTPLLGSIVRELVGEKASVEVLMESAIDPHDWQPSAKDVEQLEEADLIVANGLHLEESLEDALEEAQAVGIPVFEAGEHIEVRTIGVDEAVKHDGLPAGEGGEPDHESDEHRAGAADPHFWTDPLAMRDVVRALASTVEALGLDLGSRSAELRERLEELDREIVEILAEVPPERRKLVTGHESMGYFARRYGFAVEGAIIPGLTSQAEVSAAELAELKEQIEQGDAPAVFTEIGTPSQVAKAIAEETGAQLVELRSHTLPSDGSYFTYMREIATAIARALAP